MIPPPRPALARLAAALFACFPAATTAQEIPPARIDFSIHVLPAETSQSGPGGLARLENLHYRHGETMVPLTLVEGRQSMLYPYAGPKQFSLYRSDAQAEDSPVAWSAEIPANTRAAVLLLQQTPSALRTIPYWLTADDLKKPGILVNLSPNPVGIQLDGTNRFLLNAAARHTLQPRFENGASHAYQLLEAFAPDGKPNPGYTKILETNQFFPAGETQLNILIPSSASGEITLLNLSAAGVASKTAREELEKILPSLRQPKTPAR
jgi:hypothetical protein